MSTEPTHPEVVTLDPASNDDALRLAAAIRSVCDIDGRWDAAEILQALAAPPLPPEPEPWSVRGIRGSDNHEVWIYDPEMFGDKHWRTYNPATCRTWPEVCALGTPEVLEPDSVKALRKGYEREHRLSLGFAERASKAEDKAKEWEGKYDAHEVALDSVATFVFDLPDDNPARKQLGEILGMDLATEDEPAEPALVEVTEEPTDPNVVVRDNAGTAWERRRARTLPEFFYWYDGQRAWDTSDGHSWDGLLKRHGPLTLVETGGQS